MQKRMISGALALALGLGTSGCGDFLTGPKLADNPNRPTTASNANLLVSAHDEPDVPAGEPSGPHRLHLDAAVRRHAPRTTTRWAPISSATTTTSPSGAARTSAAVSSTCGGSRTPRSAGADSGFAGVAAVLEAWTIGLAADTWGDVPYSRSGGQHRRRAGARRAGGGVRRRPGQARRGDRCCIGSDQRRHHRAGSRRPGLRRRPGEVDRAGVHAQGPLHLHTAERLGTRRRIRRHSTPPRPASARRTTTTSRTTAPAPPRPTSGTSSPTSGSAS